MVSFKVMARTVRANIFLLRMLVREIWLAIGTTYSAVHIQS